ncbi:hypothetical protein AMAG_05009 [Allomyces macrogynus ATCC 38327]|uniref:SH3 domain-containing protein n=1 Tax=Allomyces macrogynus (strain ATCC 38327) TaxID=578462 RepID=A0A0L0S6P8_ALLM3|nr:hypothetical protein AMAG_05009 [Allomyces macrogynus ATCC 38327]|eukprot:KNE58197.1 hypothetical protein AMAG_05009 [Allomyces macrogynus ATCC 38327]
MAPPLLRPASPPTARLWSTPGASHLAVRQVGSEATPDTAPAPSGGTDVTTTTTPQVGAGNAAMTTSLPADPAGRGASAITSKTAGAMADIPWGAIVLGALVLAIVVGGCMALKKLRTKGQRDQTVRNVHSAALAINAAAVDRGQTRARPAGGHSHEHLLVAAPVAHAGVVPHVVSPVAGHAQVPPPWFHPATSPPAAMQVPLPTSPIKNMPTSPVGMGDAATLSAHRGTPARVGARSPGRPSRAATTPHKSAAATPVRIPILPSPAKRPVEVLATAILPSSSTAHSAVPHSVVVHSYRATNHDELDLAAGDTVRVLKTFNDGWAHAVHGKTGQTGMVPLNMLRAMGTAGSLERRHAGANSLGRVLSLERDKTGAVVPVMLEPPVRH